MKPHYPYALFEILEGKVLKNRKDWVKRIKKIGREGFEPFTFLHNGKNLLIWGTQNLYWGRVSVVK